jgi:hypothetical protein
LVATFFDDRQGITYTVRLPLYKDDNWNLGGYFTLAGGKRVPIAGWSPQAAQGRGREVIQTLLAEGRIGPGQISGVRRTHQRVMGGDGGQHWIPVMVGKEESKRQSPSERFRAGQAAFWAYEAARIPTAAVPKGASAEFARGWRQAHAARNAAAGMAVLSSALGVAGLGVTVFRLPQGYTLKDDRGNRLSVSWSRGRPDRATFTGFTPNAAAAPSSRSAVAAPRARGRVTEGSPTSPPAATRQSNRTPALPQAAARRPAATGVTNRQRVQPPQQQPPKEPSPAPASVSMQIHANGALAAPKDLRHAEASPLQQVTGVRVAATQSTAHEWAIERLRNLVGASPGNLGGEQFTQLTWPTEAIPTTVFPMVFGENGRAATQESHRHNGPRRLSIFTGPEGAAVSVWQPQSKVILKILFPPNSTHILEFDPKTVHAFSGGPFAAVSTHLDDALWARPGGDGDLMKGQTTMSPFPDDARVVEVQAGDAIIPRPKGVGAIYREAWGKDP